MTRRKKLEIYYDVLTTMKGGESKPTRIMSASNISWHPLNKILAFMMKNDIIEETTENEKKRYQMTEKGEKFYMYLDGMSKMVSLNNLY